MAHHLAYDADSKNLSYWAIRLSLPKVDTDVYVNDYKDVFQEWLKGFSKKWVFQLENPGDNPHFQCWAQSSVPLKATDIRVSLFKTFFEETDRKSYPLTYVAPASNEGKEALKKYCIKSATRVLGPWMDESAPIPIVVLEESKFHLWQKSLTDFVKSDPDDRTIIWLTDTKGNSGKTAWAKAMFAGKLAYVIRYAKLADMAYELSCNRSRRAYIFDLSRTAPFEFKHSDLLSMLESIKDGLITSSKYKSETWIQNTSHVIVLSNSAPPKGALSSDRLIQYSIESGNLIEIN